MSKHKKIFPCNHYGFGQYCHRCRNHDLLKEKKRNQISESNVPEEILGVSLVGFPEVVTKRAQIVLNGLAAGNNHRVYHGKQINFDRSLVSIPLPLQYRLICRHESETLRPIKILSHQDYNQQWKVCC